MTARLSKLIALRLAFGVLILLVISVLIFSAMAFLPGDFAHAVLGQNATPETVAAFQRQIGLDRPPVERYLSWLGGVLQGDLGQSFASRPHAERHVSDIIGPRLGKTLLLAGLTAALAVPLAVGLGIATALWRDGPLDRLANGVALLAISMPEFLVAYLLILLLAVQLPLFSSLASVHPGAGLAETLPVLVLPVLTLALVIVAHIMRMTRTAIIALMATPWVQMAQLKGLSPARIILRHALPNAWAPIANVIAFNIAYLIVGVVIVEVVFVYPGIGQVLVDAVRNRDIPVVQACTLIFAATYIVLNLIADIVAIVTNPRLSHPR